MHVTICTDDRTFRVQCTPNTSIKCLHLRILEHERKEFEQKDIEMTNRFNDWINGTGDCPKYAVKFEDPDPEHPGDYLVRRKRMSTFEKLVERVRRRERMSDEDARDACIAYARFLELKQSTEDKYGRVLSPPDFIDKIWHLHILDTVNYARDTAWFSDSLDDNNHQPSTIGPTIMHDPDRAFDSHSTRRARARNTVLAYRIRFGPKPEKAQERFWQFLAFEESWKPKLELDKDIPRDVTEQLEQASKTKKASDISQSVLLHEGQRLQYSGQTVERSDIKDGDEIWCMMFQVGC